MMNVARTMAGNTALLSAGRKPEQVPGYSTARSTTTDQEINFAWVGKSAMLFA